MKKLKICAVQFEREANYNKALEKVNKLISGVMQIDFLLVGGEFSLKESVNDDPYPGMINLAKKLNCNVVAPINANRKRSLNLSKGEKGVSSMHVFNRKGEIVAIQDKQHFYWKEKAWFKQGKGIKVFKVEDIRIGLIRGLDLMYPTYCQALIDANVLFVSTMSTDNLMLDLARVRSVENQAYVVMSSFIGPYVGLEFIGNAAIIQPKFNITKSMKIANQSEIITSINNEGIVEAIVDIDYINAIKREYPMKEL